MMLRTKLAVEIYVTYDDEDSMLYEISTHKIMVIHLDPAGNSKTIPSVIPSHTHTHTHTHTYIQTYLYFSV